MKNQHENHSVLEIILFSLILLVFLSVDSFAVETQSSDPNQSSKYMEAVLELADNVLKYERGTYDSSPIPLFVGGANFNTHEPVCNSVLLRTTGYAGISVAVPGLRRTTNRTALFCNSTEVKLIMCSLKIRHRTFDPLLYEQMI